MTAPLRVLQRISQLLAASEDPVRDFATVMDLVNEELRVTGARLLSGGRVRAEWGQRRGETLRLPSAEHATLELEPAGPVDAEGRTFLECVATSLGLALDAEDGRELALARARRLEEVLAVVCHDLRSPLGTIFLSLGLLERAQRNGANGRGDRDTLAIRAAAEQIDRFVEDLVELRRVENGLVTLEKNRQDPATIAAEATSTRRPPLLARRSLDLVPRVAATLPTITVDRARLLRTIARIVEHTARSTPRGSKLELAVAEAPRGSVKFTVRAPSPHVLDEADILAAAGRTPGTGFGLDLASRVVRDHGGEMFARARDGMLEIGFTLPADGASERAAA